MFVYRQNYRKTTEWITVKNGGWMQFGSGKNTFNLGVGVDPGFVYYLYNERYQSRVPIE